MRAQKKTSKLERTRNTKESSSSDNYVRFLKAAALQGIGLEKAEAEVDRIALAEAQLKQEDIGSTLETSFDVLHHTEDHLAVGAHFILLQRTGKKRKGAKPLLRIECGFSALFKLGFACDEAMANRFTNAEARLVFWPYLRHFVADMTYRMSINPVLVPLVTAQEPSTVD